MIIYVAIIVLVLSLILLLYRTYLKNIARKNIYYKKRYMRVITLYKILTKFSLINKEILKIKKRLYDNKVHDEFTLQYEAVLYYLISWFISIFSFALFLIYCKDDKFLIFILFFLSYYLKNVFIDLFVGDDTKLLYGLTEFIEDLGQSFLNYDDVDAAFEEASNESSNYLVVRHAKKVENAMQDEHKLERFIEESSNDYLKCIAINCSLTKEYGDKEDKYGNSFFIKNLNNTNDLIKTELIKRSQLKYWLRGLSFYVLIILLFFNPYEKWVHNKMPVSDYFYKGSDGLILKMIITVTTITIFIILRRYSQTDVKKNKIKDVFWEEKILKISLINKLIKLIMPRKGSKRYYKNKKLTLYSQTYIKIEWIYLRKVITSILSFIVMIVIFITLHKVNYQNINKNNTDTFDKNIIAINGKQVDTTDIENKILKSIKSKNLNSKDKEKIKAKLELMGVKDSSQLDYLTKKITNKKYSLNSEHIKLYEIFIALVISCAAYKIPETILKINTKLSKYDMENEIVVFETIILILMNYESTTPELILEYMAKFSNCFSHNLYVAINGLQKGNKEVLNKLIEDVNYKPFKNIINGLIKSENIAVKEAFANLDRNRAEYTQERKGENEKIVEKRKVTGGMIANIPLILFITIYITFPMLYISYNRMDTLQTQINSTSIQN